MPRDRTSREPTPTAAVDSFRATFGEDLRDVLDVNGWRTGDDLAAEYPQIATEVADALRAEKGHQQRTRAEIFPKLCDPASGLPGGGVFRANRDVLEKVRRGLLLNGGVEACDATVHTHDTLPLTIYQIGVSLVSYRGDRGTWHQRLFRRDLRERGDDGVDETLRLLERRHERAALNHGTPSDGMGELARKVVMDYAERAVLLKRSKAVWLMGHGNPVSYELLTGGGLFPLMVAAMGVLRKLIDGHRKFVFVASEPRERMLLTIGQALEPGWYAVVMRLDERLRQWIHQFRFKTDDAGEADWDGKPLPPPQWIPRFLDEVASQVVIGVYRATRASPAQVFYAHRDHAHYAAHVVLADSMLQEHRGFPLLIDLAHHVCASVFGGALRALTETAYAAAGEPWRYFSERTTRA